MRIRFIAISRRRKMLINRKFQLRFLSYSVAVALGTSWLFFEATSHYFNRVTESLIERGSAADTGAIQLLVEVRHELQVVLLATSALTSLFLIFTGLRFSHRIAGPIYSLRRHLDRIAEDGGKLEPIKFRDGDYFPELADSFNRVSLLNTKLAEERDRKAS